MNEMCSFSSHTHSHSSITHSCENSQMNQVSSKWNRKENENNRFTFWRQRRSENIKRNCSNCNFFAFILFSSISSNNSCVFFAFLSAIFWKPNGRNTSRGRKYFKVQFSASMTHMLTQRERVRQRKSLQSNQTTPHYEIIPFYVR